MNQADAVDELSLTKAQDVFKSGQTSDNLKRADAQHQYPTNNIYEFKSEFEKEESNLKRCDTSTQDDKGSDERDHYKSDVKNQSSKLNLNMSPTVTLEDISLMKPKIGTSEQQERSKQGNKCFKKTQRMILTINKELVKSERHPIQLKESYPTAPQTSQATSNSKSRPKSMMKNP